jgi:sulfur-oxidizing protein SoxY
MDWIDRMGRRAPSRRELLKGAAALAGACGPLMRVAVRPANATTETMDAAIRKVVGTVVIGKGKIALDIPPLVENGNTIPLVITVESPMTETDYVKAIHIFNERNPQPYVIDIKLGPRAGKATVSTRIRLSDSQKVVGIAEMSDGSFWSHSVEVIVTLAACLESTI